jgi:hypothetical protein
MPLAANFKSSDPFNRIIIRNQRNRKERRKNRNEGRNEDVENKERNPSNIKERRGENI